MPISYGGLTFKFDDPNTLLIGGSANSSIGSLFSVQVVRGADNHITGFLGSTTPFASAHYNDGGVVYGPGNVLFLAHWPVNEVGQLKPGSTEPDKIISLNAYSPPAVSSVAALSFVPPTFPGAGQLKLVAHVINLCILW